MINALKIARLAEYQKLYNNANSIILIKYSNKNTATLNAIKTLLQEKNCGTLKIIQNKIFNLVLKKENIKTDDVFKLKDQLAVIFTTNIIDASKVIIKLKKKLKLDIVGCIENNVCHSDEHVTLLSKTPDLATQRKLLITALLYAPRTFMNSIIKPSQMLLETLKTKTT